MTNNRKIRLIQVAKEFKVGLNTIMDYLLKKGVNIDGSPNSPVSPEVYAILEKEFGANRTITGNERDSIRERISFKQGTVTLDEAKKSEKDADDHEVIIKSNVISVKDEIPRPKILGKIDLGGPKKKAESQKTEEPAKPQPAPEQPKQEEPKKEEPRKAEPQPAPAASEVTPPNLRPSSPSKRHPPPHRPQSRRSPRPK